MRDRLENALGIFKENILDNLNKMLNDRDEVLRIKNIIDKTGFTLDDINDLLLDYSDKELELEDIYNKVSYGGDIYNNIVNSSDSFGYVILLIIYGYLIKDEDKSFRVLDSIINIGNDIDFDKLSFLKRIIEIGDLPIYKKELYSPLTIKFMSEGYIKGEDKDITVAKIIHAKSIIELYYDESINKSLYKQYNDYIDSLSDMELGLINIYSNTTGMYDKYLKDKENKKRIKYSKNNIYDFLFRLNEQGNYDIYKVYNLLDRLRKCNGRNNNKNKVSHIDSLKQIRKEFYQDCFYRGCIPTDSDFINYFNSNYPGVVKLDHAILYDYLKLGNFDILINKDEDKISSLGGLGKLIVEEKEKELNETIRCRDEKYKNENDTNIFLQILKDNNIDLGSDKLVYYLYKYASKCSIDELQDLKNQISLLARKYPVLKKSIQQVNLFKIAGRCFFEDIMSEDMPGGLFNKYLLSYDLFSKWDNKAQEAIKLAFVPNYISLGRKHINAFSNSIDIGNNIVGRISLDFVKDLLSIIKENNYNNLYEEIHKREYYFDFLCNKCFKSALEKMPESSEAINLIKVKYNDDKEAYLANKELELLRKYSLSDSINFKIFCKNNNISYNYNKYNKLLELAKKYDLDLYNSVLKHEDNRCLFIINDYMNGDYNSIKYYLINKGISSYDFDYVQKYISVNYPGLYKQYNIYKEENSSQSFAILLCRIKEMARRALDGIEENGVFRKYDYLDFRMDTKISYDDLNRLLRNNPILTKDEYRAIKKLYGYSNKAVKIDKQLLYDEVFITNGMLVTKEVKDAAFMFIKENNLPYELALYNIIIKRYYNGSLDLSDYIDNNSVVSNKSKKLIKRDSDKKD